jgi:hypothetical protein
VDVSSAPLRVSGLSFRCQRVSAYDS